MMSSVEKLRSRKRFHRCARTSGLFVVGFLGSVGALNVASAQSVQVATVNSSCASFAIQPDGSPKAASASQLALGGVPNPSLNSNALKGYELVSIHCSEDQSGVSLVSYGYATSRAQGVQPSLYVSLFAGRIAVDEVRRQFDGDRSGEVVVEENGVLVGNSAGTRGKPATVGTTDFATTGSGVAVHTNPATDRAARVLTALESGSISQRQSLLSIAGQS